MSAWLATWSWFFGAAATTALVAAATWWVIRRRRREMRFPILRVLNIPQTKLPRMVIRKPPLIPFLTFLISVLAFALWTAKPRVKIFASHDPQQLRVHAFVDMSPSISAHMTTQQLAHTVAGLWTTLGSSSRITLSTSHGDTIYEVRDGAQVEDIIQGLGFHRAGVRIGSALKSHLAQTGEVDRLLIISDRDQHSWAGFQWQYLLDQAEVFFVNVDTAVEGGVKPNIFVNGVRLITPPGALSVEWEVEIAQGGLARAQEGSLRASWRGQTLATTSWKLADGRRSVLVNIAWPSTKNPDDPGSEPILWEVSPTGDDGMALDNEFRSTMNGRGGTVKIVAEPAGELPLEDPAVALLTVLKVMGLQTERVDVAAVGATVKTGTAKMQPNHEEPAPAFAILLGGLGHGTDSFCEDHGAIQSWVVPWGETVLFPELCECAARLTRRSATDCQTIVDREGWISWLESIQGKQIGGEIGQSKAAVAFAIQSVDQKNNVLALTIPLIPSHAIGLSHGRFPLFVRELMALQTKDRPRSGGPQQKADWLREADMSAIGGLNQGAVFAAQADLRLSNVPLGESLLATQALNQLPPIWSEVNHALAKRTSGKLDAEDPLPWIRVLAGAALLMVLVELIWRLSERRSHKTAVFGVVLGCVTWLRSTTGFSQVQLDFVQTPAATNMSFSRVAREVSARTSIEFLPKVAHFEWQDPAALEVPWMWLRSTDRMVDRKGGMTAEVVRWLKRGGFLVIEATQGDDVAWDKFAKPLENGTFRPTGWRPVPQDHELMRSFYLLDTLPACDGKVWRWYGIDGRLAMLHIPYSLSGVLQDQPIRNTCDGMGTTEYQTRVFVNILMVALTTDYKRDQIHLPEILKRLRVP